MAPEAGKRKPPFSGLKKADELTGYWAKETQILAEADLKLRGPGSSTLNNKVYHGLLLSPRILLYLNRKEIAVSIHCHLFWTLNVPSENEFSIKSGKIQIPYKVLLFKNGCKIDHYNGIDKTFTEILITL